MSPPLPHRVIPPEARVPMVFRRRVALGIGAAAWLVVFMVGVAVPDGWMSRAAGAHAPAVVGLIALWLLILVLAPLAALGDPVRHQARVHLYLVGMVATMAATFLARLWGGLPEFMAAGVPLAAMLCSGLILWAYWEWR